MQCVLISESRAKCTRPHRRLYLSSGWPLASSLSSRSLSPWSIRVVFLMEHDYCQSISVPLSRSLPVREWEKTRRGEQWHLMTIDGRADGRRETTSWMEPRPGKTFGSVANQSMSAMKDNDLRKLCLQQSREPDVKWLNAAPNKRIARFQSKF